MFWFLAYSLEKYFTSDQQIRFDILLGAEYCTAIRDAYGYVSDSPVVMRQEVFDHDKSPGPVWSAEPTDLHTRIFFLFELCFRFISNYK